MKKLRQLEESKFLQLFFAFVSACFLIAAVCMPDRSNMLTGFVEILTKPCKISTNYFALGGLSATFFNMGVVGLFCWALTFLPGCKVTNVTTLGFLLTVGFASWGMNLVNHTPPLLF